MSDWTINGKTLAALGVTGLTLRHAMWSRCAAEIMLDGRNADAPALFAKDAAVEIKYGSTVRFVGTAMGTGRSMKGGAEGQSLTVPNAWRTLERTIFQQPWQTGGSGGSTKQKGRCIVGLAADGNYQTVEDAMAAVLTAAGVVAGTLDLDYTFEPFEVLNVMCSEVLAQLARKVPRAAQWWTYPGGVPTFHAAVASGSTVLAATADTAVDLMPNWDAAATGVDLAYEIVKTVDDEEVTDVLHDTAGATTGAGRLIQTIPWRGSTETWLRQKVKVRTIPLVPVGTDAQKKTTRQFWAERCPELRDAAPVPGDADLTPEIRFLPFNPAVAGAQKNTRGQQPVDTVGIGPVDGSGNYYFAVQLAHKDGGDGATQYELADPADEDSEQTELDTTLPRYLLEGVVTPWMVKRGRAAQRWTLHAFVTWLGPGSPGFHGAEVHINFTATDCTTREYRELQNYDAGDPIPSGRAAALYALLSAPVHEGQIVRVEEECSGWVTLGDRLTVTGGAAEWQTMTAYAQAVTENIAAGVTDVAVGAGVRAQFADLLEIMRMDRRRVEADTQAGAGNFASQGDGTP